MTEAKHAEAKSEKSETTLKQEAVHLRAKEADLDKKIEEMTKERTKIRTELRAITSKLVTIEINKKV